MDKFLRSLPEPTPDVIICGDFNLPKADWKMGCHTSGAPLEEQKMITDWMEFANEHFLIQQISGATHQDGNTLDLLFVNNSDYIHNHQLLRTIQSDHFLVEFTTSYRTDNTETSEESEEETTSKEEATFKDLNFFSEDINWECLEDDLAYMKFLEICLNICRQHVPMKSPKQQHRGRQTRIPRIRRKLMRRRHRTKLQLLKATSDRRKEKLTCQLIQIEKEIKESHRIQQEDQENNAINNIERSPQYFFSYAKRFIKIRNGIGPLIDACSALVTCPKKMAEILSQQYSRVFSTPIHTKSKPEELFKRDGVQNDTISNMIFTEDDLIEAMGEISHNSAAGPDGYPAILLWKTVVKLYPDLFT